MWLDVRVDGKPYRAVSVVFSLDSEPPRRGATLVAAMGATGAIGAVRALAVTRPPPAIEATRPWASPQPEPPRPSAGLGEAAGPTPAVLRGQTVAIGLHDNGIVIETSGQALADGRIGQQVPVRATGNSGGRQVFSATVIAERRVTIATR